MLSTLIKDYPLLIAQIVLEEMVWADGYLPDSSGNMVAICYQREQAMGYDHQIIVISYYATRVYISL